MPTPTRRTVAPLLAADWTLLASRIGGVLRLSHALPAQGTTAGGTVVRIAAVDALVSEIVDARFGGVPSPDVRLTGLFSIRAVAPPHAAGVVDIEVRLRVVALGVTMERVLRLTDGYTYVPPPAVTEIDRVGGHPSGGTPEAACAGSHG
jgi:hypothetical protein